MKENTAAPIQTEPTHGTLLCKVFIEAIILIRLKTTKHQQCQQLESREFCSFPTCLCRILLILPRYLILGMTQDKEREQARPGPHPEHAQKVQCEETDKP